MAAISLCMYCKMLFSVGSSLLETSSPPLHRFHIAVLKTPFVAEMNQEVLSTLSGVLSSVYTTDFVAASTPCKKQVETLQVCG